VNGDVLTGSEGKKLKQEFTAELAEDHPSPEALRASRGNGETVEIREFSSAGILFSA